MAPSPSVASDVSVIGSRLLKSSVKWVKAIRTLVIILAVWATKAAISHLAYDCPCFLSAADDKSVPPKRLGYGIMFIVMPGVILWLIGILMLDSTWRGCTGTGCRIRARISYVDRGCRCCWYTLSASALAPCTWLTLIFLDGSFLQCVMSDIPSTCVDGAGVDAARLAAAKLENADIQWMSAIIAASMGVGLFLLYFVVVLCNECCSPTAYYERIYSDQIRELELEALVAAAREHNFAHFKKKWRMIFHGGCEDDWEDVSGLPRNNPHRSHKGTLYTNFHSWGVDFTAGHPDDKPYPIQFSDGRNVALLTKEAMLMEAYNMDQVQSQMHGPAPVPGLAMIPATPAEGSPVTARRQQRPLPPIHHPAQTYPPTTVGPAGPHHPLPHPIPTPQPLYPIDGQYSGLEGEVPVVQYALPPKEKKKKTKKKKKKSQIEDSSEA